MKELDLLKRDWQKNTAFKQISETEIYTMLHKKSTSIVKWILIVSILEFVILNGFSFLINDPEYDVFIQLHPYFNYLIVFNYLLSLVFIYFFYQNFKSISVLDSSKVLLKDILKTRKTVGYYIYWNIFFGGFCGALTFLEGLNKGFNSGRVNKVTLIEINYISIIFAGLLIMSVIWLFYKLIYGRFLSNLKQNYKELQKLEE